MSDLAAALWQDALAAARLLALDPHGCGGVLLRARPGPLRDAWMDHLRAVMPQAAPWRRIPAGINDDGLIGGIDLPATLKAGRAIFRKGLLAASDGGVILIPSAERLSDPLAARIAQAMDAGEALIEREGVAQRFPSCFAIVAIDEGHEDERVPTALQERLAFHIDLDRVTRLQPSETPARPRPRAAMRPVASDDMMKGLAATALQLGIDDMRAPMLALRVAQCAATADGHREVLPQDAVLATRLVLAPRARQWPQDDIPDEHPPQPARDPSSSADSEDAPPQREALPDVLLAAARTVLPPGLIDIVRAGTVKPRHGTTRGAGREAKALRGRPAGQRPGRPTGGTRLDLVSTLRAAAPWQAMRKRGAGRIEVRSEDLRIRKFVKRSETTVVFCVDASGSAAFHRLAEAKGAVELLLAEAYVSRTHVSLVAFRGEGADVLLPPTRSLARAKMTLATLPGGGGTPLAAGIDAAAAIAVAERAKGRAPLVVILTDGRANIAADGKPDRTRATTEAMEAASRLNGSGVASVFIDTSARAGGAARSIADAMAAHYLALPNAQSLSVLDAVRTAVTA